jgi:hypothetical protein
VTAARPPWPARLLAFLLVVWEPALFALTASAALERLLFYGWPAVLLLSYRALIVGLGIAAGRSLWTLSPAGPRLARWWALSHAVAVLLTFGTPYFPSNRVPGTKGPTLAMLLAWDAAWWAWLRWSPRLRRVYRDAQAPGGQGR